jgi:FkbM family methyltransferase
MTVFVVRFCVVVVLMCAGLLVLSDWTVYVHDETPSNIKIDRATHSQTTSCRDGRVYQLCMQLGGGFRLEEFYSAGAQDRFIDSFPFLSNDSIVIDIGSFTGETLHKIWTKYQPYIYAFEPVQDFRQVLEKKFKDGNGKISIFPYGIGGEHRVVSVALAGHATSTMLNSSHQITREITLQPLDEFFARFLPNASVDLLSINCEGCEYDVLTYIVNSQYATRMKHILIQFHRLGHNWHQQRCCLQQSLSKTHFQYFSYPNIWEGWVLRP